MTGHRIEQLSTVDSTNAEAMRRVGAGEAGPLWIMADEQTAGRGRSGRSWTSTAGNLHASLLITLAAPASKACQLALVAGVAVFDAIEAAMAKPPAGLLLKWPNDVLIDGEKAGGILIESTSTPAGLAAVIGVGVNIAIAPATLDRPATCLAAHGGSPTPEALLAQLARSAAALLEVWADGEGFPVIREAWLNRAHPIGERLSINTGAERTAGAFLGLDPEGALLLDIDGAPRRFTFGDVSLAR